MRTLPSRPIAPAQPPAGIHTEQAITAVGVTSGPYGQTTADLPDIAKTTRPGYSCTCICTCMRLAGVGAPVADSVLVVPGGNDARSSHALQRQAFRLRYSVRIRAGRQRRPITWPCVRAGAWWPMTRLRPRLPVAANQFRGQSHEARSMARQERWRRTHSKPADQTDLSRHRGHLGQARFDRSPEDRCRGHRTT